MMDGKGKGAARDSVLYSYRNHPKIGRHRMLVMYSQSTKNLLQSEKITTELSQGKGNKEI